MNVLMEQREVKRLGAGTVLGVLLGNRESIETAARSRGALLVGVPMLLAAALARDYDGRYLVREPWWLAMPFVVSMGLGLMLYVITRGSTVDRPAFWPGYRSFLGVMWMMAPMALLYGLPWERWMSPVDAVRANLWTLAVVSLWRVVLMARIVHVLTGLRGWAALFRVSLVAAPIGYAAVLLVPRPVFDVMGGIRQTPAERLLAYTAMLAGFFGIFVLMVCLVGGLLSFTGIGGAWIDLKQSKRRPGLGAWLVALICLAPWIIALPKTQAEQRLRWEVESEMKAGNIARGLGEMSRHRREDFPPQWDPPPRIGWDEEEIPTVVNVVEQMLAMKAAPWVREVYLDKLERRYAGRHGMMDEWERVEAILSQTEEGRRFMEASEVLMKNRAELNPTTRTTRATTKGIDP